MKLKFGHDNKIADKPGEGGGRRGVGNGEGRTKLKFGCSLMDGLGEFVSYPACGVRVQVEGGGSVDCLRAVRGGAGRGIS